MTLTDRANDLMRVLRASARDYATEQAMTEARATVLLMKELSGMLPPDVTSANDGRGTDYRVRLTLFANDVLVADSDPEIAPNEPGMEVIRGLMNVGTWARQCAEAYHGMELEGLGAGAIRKSISSLRPSMSRNNGTHNWRLRYTAGGVDCLANILVVTEP